MAQSLAHPVGKRRAGHLSERCWVHSMHHGVGRMALAHRADCVSQGGGFVLVVEQAEEQRLHERISIGDRRCYPPGCSCDSLLNLCRPGSTTTKAFLSSSSE